MKKVYIIAPSYNDLKSLNKLLQIINKNLRNLNIMRDWKVCLKEYIENEFNSINL